MKTFLAVVTLVLATATASAQSHPVFFSTAGDNARFASWKANYEANPTAPTQLGGQIYKRLKTDADSGGRYMDFGQLGAFMYHMSGDSAYVTKAWTQLSTQTYHMGANFLNLSGCTNAGISGNYSRFFGWQLVLMYDWLYPGMTADQRTTFLNQLNAMAACVTAAGGPAGWDFRAGDTDQTVGDYFMVAMLNQATGSYNGTVAGYWADATRKIGGYASTAKDLTQRRNTMRTYIEDFAVGGEWIESSEYNFGSTDTLVVAAAALRSAQSPTDNYPEVTTWLQTAAARAVLAMSPGMTTASLPYQWGDIQTARNRMDYYRWQTIACLAGTTVGTTVGPKIQDFALRYVEAVGLGTIDPYPAGFLVFDPAATRGDYTTLSKSDWASGMGILLARTGWTSTDSMFGTQFSNQASFDRLNGAEPFDHAGAPFGELQLWKNGAWAITHPIGYSWVTDGDCRGTNGVCLAGTPAATYGPREYRQETARESNTTHNFEYITGTQGGSIVNSAYYGMPSTFFHEHTRSIVWLKAFDVLVVHDRTNATAPTTTGYPTVLKNWMDAQARKQLYVHTTVSPTLGSGYIDWIYGGSSHTRVDTLLPASTTQTIENETTLWDANYAYVGTIAAAEKKFHVKIVPSATNQWDTFLNVWDPYGTGTPATVALVQDTSAKVDAALVTSGSQNILVAFNAIQGPNLVDRTLTGGTGYYPAGAPNATVLATVRIRKSSYQLVWAAGSNPTKAILADLDTGTVWQYAINGGAPADLTVSANGVAVLDIVPTGTVTLDVLANGFAPVTVTTGTLPNGRKSTAYSQALAAAGGNGSAFTWTKTVGTLPTSLSLSGAGVLSGTPSAAGDFTFTVQACDTQPSCGTREFTVTIADLPSVTTTTLPNGSVGTAYSQNLSGTGGSLPYAWTVQSGALCTGLSLSGNTISGTPTTQQTCNFTVRLTDNAAATADQALQIVIGSALPSLTVTATPSASAVVIRYGIAGLDNADSCTVNVYDAGTLAFTSTNATGAARRTVSFTGLASAHTYGVDVVCGTASTQQRVYFTTSASLSGGTVSWKYSARPSASLIPDGIAVKIVVEYNLPGAGATAVETSCTTPGPIVIPFTCTATLPLTSGQVYEIRHLWKTEGDVVLATSQKQVVAVP